MKTLLRASMFVLLFSILLSCNNEIEQDSLIKNEEISSATLLKNNNPSPYEWEESYNPYKKKTKGINEQSTQILTIPGVTPFVGGIFKKESVNNLSMEFIDCQSRPIDVTFDFPGYYFDRIEDPTYQGMMRSQKNAINSPDFSGEQISSFAYDFKQITKINEARIAFGANCNIANILNINVTLAKDRIEKGSALLARVLQQNYSIIMDYPRGGIFLNKEDFEQNKSFNPVYVNSVTFGRFAVITLFSTENYEKLRAAFKVSLTAKIINGQLELDAETRNVLEKSEMNLLIRGGKANDVVQCVKGFSEFEDFIVNGGEYNKLVPGSPILFTANYASNNSIFHTTFTTEDDLN